MSEVELPELDYRDALYVPSLDVLMGETVTLRDEHETLGTGILVGVRAVYELHHRPQWLVTLDHGGMFGREQYLRPGLVAIERVAIEPEASA